MEKEKKVLETEIKELKELKDEIQHTLLRLISYRKSEKQSI